MHVLADYGTNLEGELETFALVGRADPDPKGFAWLATMIGLFETGYVHEQGFFQTDVRDHKLQGTGMGTRLADAVRRGKAVAEHFGTDLFRVDFHAFAARDLDDVRALLHSRRSRPRRSRPAPWDSPIRPGCRNVSGKRSRNAAPADESRVPVGATREFSRRA